MGVMSARKKYGVKYPCLYATENDTKQHKEFNCVQRAHQNFLENVPFYFMLQTISAAANPKASAILGAIYLLGRVFYFRGYSSGNPDKRMQGGFQYIGLLGMLVRVLSYGCKLGLTYKLHTYIVATPTRGDCDA